MRVVVEPRAVQSGAHRRSRWLAGVSVLTLAVMGAGSAQAQTTIDYDTTPTRSTPLVLTEDTILHRNHQNIAPALQSGPISGAFNLTKTGWGSLILSGDNSGYSGVTTLQEGFIYLGHDNALGTGVLRTQEGTLVGSTGGNRFIANDIILEGDGTTIFNAEASSITLDGMIAGSGGLQKEGWNTLVINGANAYMGGTLINNGTVLINTDSALGMGIVEIVSNANLELGDGVSLTNDIELTGVDWINAHLSVGSESLGRYYGHIFERSLGLGFTKSGNGVLELHGMSSHTGVTHVAEGTLIAASAGALSQLSDVYINPDAILELQHTSNMAGLFGEGTLDTTSYLASIGYDEGDAIFEGEVIGFGDIGKRGTGTQIFASDSENFDGTVHAEVGSLLINGDFSDAEGFVYDGALLGGTGRLQLIAAFEGSTLSAGAAPGEIGTLSAGRIDMEDGSVLRVDVNAEGQSDVLSSSTSATLAGTVDVRAASGTYAPLTSYRIVQTGEGISGTFASVTTDLAFLTPELTYDADSVWLNLSRSARSFADIDGLTFNQRNVAPVAEALGAGNAIHDALVAQTEDGARAGFDSLSGEIHASQSTVLTQSSQFVRDALMARLRGGEPQTGVLSDLDTASAADAAVPANDWSLSAWGAGLGGLQAIQADGNASRVTAGTGGLLFGLEADHTGGFIVGVAGGYSGTHMDTLAGPGSADISSIHLATYGAAEIGALTLRGGAAYAWNGVKTTRQVTIGGFTDTLTANYGARTGQLFGELGYSLEVGATTIEPFAGIAHVAVGADGFTEAGGPAALTVAGLSHGTTYATIGIRGEHELQVSEDGTLTAKAGVAWQHAFDPGAPRRDLAFASGGSAFTVAGVPVARDSLMLEGGLSWQMTNGATLGAHYNGVFSGATQSHAVKGNVAFTF